MSFLLNLAESAAGKLVDNTIGKFFGDSSNKKSVQMQEQAAKRLMDYENQYNTPSNQVARLKQAGLNPAMLFGDGSSMPASASPTMPNVSPNAGAAYAQTGGNTMLNAVQMENIQADTNLKNSQANETQQKYLELKMRNQVLPQLLEKDLAYKDLVNWLTSENIGLTNKQAENVATQTELMRTNISKAEKELEILGESLRKVKSEAEIAAIQAQFTPELMQTQLLASKAHIQVDYATANQIAELAKLTFEQTNGQKIQNGINAIMRQYANQQENAKTNEMKANADTAKATATLAKHKEVYASMNAYIDFIGNALGAIHSMTTGAVDKTIGSITSIVK